MVSQAITRRRLLRIGAWLPLIGFLSLNLRTARAAEPALACVDPEEVGEGLRKSLHYTETSSDPQMICSGCNFFSAAAAVGGCGQCQIMSAAANARGHCDSWSKKQ
jgi:hypothetical protein